MCFFFFRIGIVVSLLLGNFEEEGKNPRETVSNMKRGCSYCYLVV